MELFRGIHQFRIPIPNTNLESINVYIVEGTSGNLMIDTGWNTPEMFNAIAGEMKATGFAMKDITDILITHLHPDHYGLAGKIAQLTGAKIMLSETENALLDSRYVHPENLLKQMSEFLKSNGVPDYEIKMLAEASMNIGSFLQPITPSRLLKTGDKVSMPPFEFEAIVTPGHSPGHICLYEPVKKYLFAGDHVLADVVPNIGYHPQSSENPMGDYIDSLKALGELDVNFVFPGHGSVFSGLKPKIDNILQHHRDKMMKIQKIMGVEMKDAFAIAKDVPWIVGGETLSYNKLTPIDRRLAILATLAQLQYMVMSNKGKRITQEGIIMYWAGE